MKLGTFLKSNFFDSLIYGALVHHITLTVFQNTPDTLVPPINHFSPGWDIPQWRFFAPTPGTSNHHILYRTRTKQNDEGQWGTWEEMISSNDSTLLSTIWNPNSRYVKANFDLASSIVNMVSYGATFDFIKSSESYLMVSSILNSRLQNTDSINYQFLIATSTRDKQDSSSFSFEPKFFSEVHEVR